jgi:hypothetical protein
LEFVLPYTGYLELVNTYNQDICGLFCLFLCFRSYPE